MKAATSIASTNPASLTALPVELKTPSGIKEWCLARADEWYARGDLPIALNFLEHAAAIDRYDAPVRITIGSIQFMLKRPEAALKSFLKAQRVDPSYPTLLLHLAATCQELKRDAEAENYFREALKLQPENCEASRLFAGFLMSRERLDDARDVVESGLGADPRDIDLLLRLGVCYFRAANLRAASACFQRILQLDPINEIARQNLEIVNQHSQSQNPTAA